MHLTLNRDHFFLFLIYDAVHLVHKSEIKDRKINIQILVTFKYANSLLNAMSLRDIDDNISRLYSVSIIF